MSAYLVCIIWLLSGCHHTAISEEAPLEWRREKENYFSLFFPKKSDLLRDIENTCSQGHSQCKTARLHEKDKDDDDAITFILYFLRIKNPSATQCHATYRTFTSLTQWVGTVVLRFQHISLSEFAMKFCCKKSEEWKKNGSCFSFVCVLP